jgi:hypothetical protein
MVSDNWRKRRKTKRNFFCKNIRNCREHKMIDLKIPELPVKGQTC